MSKKKNAEFTSVETLLTRIDELKNVTKIQCSKGNFDQGEYMRGMANGMILALATMQGDEPVYLEVPVETLQERINETTPDEPIKP